MNTTALVISSLVILGIGYSLYDPILMPDGLEQAWKVKVFIWILKLNSKMASIGETIGFGTSLNNSRALLRHQFVLINMLRSSQGVVAVDDIIDGVPVRIYYPENLNSENLPAMIYMHGGGWTEGDIEVMDPFPRKIAAAIKGVAVSIDYRLSPEHPFPASIDDCVKVAKYILNNGKDIGVDPSRVAIGGDSAGGHLTATVSLKLRGNKPNTLRGQVINVPALQSIDLNSPSYLYNEKHFNGGPLQTRERMAFYYLMHALGGDKGMAAMLEGRHVAPDVWKVARKSLDYSLLPQDEIMREYVQPDVKPIDPELSRELKDIMLDPYYNPLLAGNVTGVPEAYVVTCQHDVLRDDGILYAKKLEKAGVKVTLVNLPYDIHAFTIWANSMPSVDRAIDGMIQFLKRVLK